MRVGNFHFQLIRLMHANDSLFNRIQVWWPRSRWILVVWSCYSRCQPSIQNHMISNMMCNKTCFIWCEIVVAIQGLSLHSVWLCKQCLPFQVYVPDNLNLCISECQVFVNHCGAIERCHTLSRSNRRLWVMIEWCSVLQSHITHANGLKASEELSRYSLNNLNQVSEISFQFVGAKTEIFLCLWVSIDLVAHQDYVNHWKFGLNVLPNEK